MKQLNIAHIYLNKTSLMVLFSLLLSCCAIGQDAVYKSLTKKDGLPSNTVYRVIEDSKGFIWIATEGGVCRYNGRDLKCFTEEDGLPSEDIFVIYEDGIGRIWCINASNRLSYIKNDKVHTFAKGSLKRTQLLWENEGHLIFRLDNTFKDVKDDNTFKDKKLNHRPNNWFAFKIFQDTYLKYLNNHHILFCDTLLNTIDSLSFDNAELERFSYQEFALDGLIIHNGGHNESYYILNPIEKTLERVWLDVDDDACSFKMINQYHRPNQSIQTFLKNKLFIYSTKDEHSITIKIPPQKDNINTALLSSNNTLWVSTNNGLKYLLDKNNFKERINTERSNILKLVSLGDQLYYGDDKGRVFKNSSKTTVLDLSENETDCRFSILEFQDSILLAKTTTSDLLKSNVKVASQKMDSKEFNSDRKYLTITNCQSTAKEAFILDDYIYLNSHIYLFRSDITEKSSCTILDTIGSNGMLAGSIKEHIIVYVNKGVALLREIDTITGDLQTLNSLDVVNQVLIEHLSNGFFLVSGKKSNYIFYKDSTFLISNLGEEITSCKTYADTSYLLSNKHLYRTTRNSNNTYNDQVDTVLRLADHFTEKSSTVSDFEIISDTLFLATDEGLMNVKLPRALNPAKVPNLYIQSVNTYLTTSEKKIEIEYSDNDITIALDAHLFSENPTIHYEYQLLGVESTQQKTIEGQVRYPNLSSGKYIFQAQAVDDFGNKSEMKVLRFKIKSPWWMHPLLLALYFIALVAFIYLIVNYYIKREQKKSDLDQKYAELELSALQSQMNPHFIFNALNSIQNLVIKEDILQADLYIIKFSMLMRQFLEGSKQKFITLQDELEIVDAYLGMEKLRFGDRLTYQSNINVELDSLMSFVPATIIQPFVENALIHGIFHKKGNGHISMELTKENDYLIFTIEDDGIGRQKAELLKDKRKLRHISRGKQLVNEKKNLINKKWGFDLSIETIDLFDVKDHATGTKIIIKWRQKNIMSELETN